ncbi:MAG TPA: ribosome small subunit-dependent GTPase A [Clostridiales bacterium]|nr:ribosome small subunit-dependent GTPase A [Clostridiales bacterium]
MTENFNNAQKGIIIKSIGGLYLVESPSGLFECKARGVFRNQGLTPYIGDDVIFEDGVINELLPRRNEIIRPPIANLDQIILIVSTCKPVPNILLMDKFIAISEYKGIKPIVMVTKIDLASFEQIFDIYKRVGVETFVVDYNNDESIQEIKQTLKGKISVFTGNSGVGKSTLMNAIDSTLSIPTGEISEKLGRGRHTTRHAELYKIKDGGYIADTPGFSTFETNKYDIIKKEELSSCFVEFREYMDDCKFKDCSHTKEKGCAVIEAVNNGDIAESRHKSYCYMYEEAKQIKEWEL